MLIANTPYSDVAWVAGGAALTLGITLLVGYWAMQESRVLRQRRQEEQERRRAELLRSLAQTDTNTAPPDGDTGDQE